MIILCIYLPMTSDNITIETSNSISHSCLWYVVHVKGKHSEKAVSPENK